MDPPLAVRELLAIGQIRSDPTSGPAVGFHEALFTLPPNRTTTTEQCQISVVSSDSDTVPSGDKQARDECHHRNVVRATHRQNEATLEQAE